MGGPPSVVDERALAAPPTRRCPRGTPLRELADQLTGRDLLPAPTSTRRCLPLDRRRALHPVALVQAAGAADVVGAVQYAASHDLDVSVAMLMLRWEQGRRDDRSLGAADPRSVPRRPR